MRARDVASKLLYLILLGEFKDESNDCAKAFNAVFVVSHSGTFKWRTGTVARAAYEERFVVSIKQRARLDQWLKGNAAKQAADSDGDATTEETTLRRATDKYIYCYILAQKKELTQIV